MQSVAHSLWFFLVFSMRIYPVVTDKNERYNQLDWVQLTLILRKKKKKKREKKENKSAHTHHGQHLLLFATHFTPLTAPTRVYRVACILVKRQWHTCAAPRTHPRHPLQQRCPNQQRKLNNKQWTVVYRFGDLPLVRKTLSRRHLFN